MKCSDDGGFVHVCDIRNDKPLFSKQLSDSATTGVTLSSSVPGLLVTASENEYVRIWDLENNQMELVHEKKLKLVIAAINFIYFCVRINLSLTN